MDDTNKQGQNQDSNPLMGPDPMAQSPGMNPSAGNPLTDPNAAILLVNNKIQLNLHLNHKLKLTMQIPICLKQTPSLQRIPR